MSKKRFVTDDYLLPKLPIFLPNKMNEKALEKLVDLIEEEVILDKAREIQEKRNEQIKRD